VNALVERKVTISNDLGLHLRAAGALVQVASRFACEVWIKRGNADANAKSIMSVLSLAAAKGTELLVVAEGSDANDAVAAVADLIDGGFKH
jgi:phosphocarrier protein HPr